MGIIQYGKVWIDCMKDCGENEGGYYCVVYADEEYEDEIDSFCIYPEYCDCTNEQEVKEYIIKYAEMYQ